MNKVIVLRKIKPAFPAPRSIAEQKAFFHMQGLEMTLKESETFVHKVKSKRAQKLREETLLEAITKRMRKKWNRDLSKQYWEWVGSYSNYLGG